MIGTATSALRHPGQAIGAMPAALAQVATTPPRPRDFDPVGLTMYFTLRLRGLELGKWASCSGIGVKLNPVGLGGLGGDYQSQDHLPGRLSYPALSLERAMHKDESAALQKWLRDFVRDWVSGDLTKEGTTATVVLKDAAHREVARWEFADVYPESWSGPDLSASAGRVATERLTLVHGGFIPDGPKARMAELKSEVSKKAVRFLMPQSLTVSRGTGNWQDWTGPGGGVGEGRARGRFWAFGRDSLVLTEVRLRGPDTQVQAQLLQDWATKRPADPGREGSEMLPVLLFTWGEFRGAGRAVKVNLGEGVSISYSRFSAAGRPLEATITNLRLTILEPNEKPTNPTSGGPPGRATHLLISGETLAHLAYREYGRPDLWRDLARVNGVDDPTALRPGMAIYLPSLAELTGQG